MARSSTKTAIKLSSVIVRTTEYLTYKEGDKVIVLDEGGRKIPAVTFEFRCHAVNTKTGAEWLEVYGGKHGHHTSRAFKIERVEPSRTRRRRKKTA